jgi:hypothetical protein
MRRILPTCESSLERPAILEAVILLPVKVTKKAGEAGEAGDPAVGQPDARPLVVPWATHEDDSPNCERSLERPPILETLLSCPSLPAQGNS